MRTCTWAALCALASGWMLTAAAPIAGAQTPHATIIVGPSDTHVDFNTTDSIVLHFNAWWYDSNQQVNDTCALYADYYDSNGTWVSPTRGVTTLASALYSLPASLPLDGWHSWTCNGTGYVKTFASSDPILRRKTLSRAVYYYKITVDLAGTTLATWTSPTSTVYFP